MTLSFNAAYSSSSPLNTLQAMVMHKEFRNSNNFKDTHFAKSAKFFYIENNYAKFQYFAIYRYIVPSGDTVKCLVANTTPRKET
jgi:hypothetical protein